MTSKSIADAFEHIVSPIWIITANHDDQSGGLVATMVIPASIVDEAPRLVMGLAKHHATESLVQSSRAFAAHLISPSQAALAERFGTQSSRDVDKFAGLNFRMSDCGNPILSDVVAWFDCRVETTMDIGDRTVFLADVVDGGELEATDRVMTTADIGSSFSPDVLKVMKQQRADDAILDAVAIARFRESRFV